MKRRKEEKIKEKTYPPCINGAWVNGSSGSNVRIKPPWRKGETYQSFCVGRKRNTKEIIWKFGFGALDMNR